MESTSERSSRVSTGSMSAAWLGKKRMTVLRPLRQRKAGSHHARMPEKRRVRSGRMFLNALHVHIQAEPERVLPC